MTTSDVDPPEDISEQIIQTLEGSEDAQLREIIHYAQQLLQDHRSLTEAVEAREGEDLVRTNDHGAYTIVIVERPDETGEARGPFSYRVKWEPNVDDEGGSYRWHYLGRVVEDTET